LAITPPSRRSVPTTAETAISPAMRLVLGISNASPADACYLSSDEVAHSKGGQWPVAVRVPTPKADL
jgi:hypothetical protein